MFSPVYHRMVILKRQEIPSYSCDRKITEHPHFAAASLIYYNYKEKKRRGRL